MREDPIGFDGGQTNLYAYANKSPSNNIDPTGNFFRPFPGSIMRVAPRFNPRPRFFRGRTKPGIRQPQSLPRPGPQELGPVPRTWPQRITEVARGAAKSAKDFLDSNGLGGVGSFVPVPDRSWTKLVPPGPPPEGQCSNPLAPLQERLTDGERRRRREAADRRCAADPRCV